MSRVIKYTVKVKAPYNKSLQCEKCNEYLWIPFWGYWLNSNCKCKNRQSKYE